MLHYTTILHAVRKRFELSNNEYCVADLIDKLSHNPAAPRPGWCNASRKYMADELGVSRQSVITIINSLESAGLLIRGANDNLQTTALWYDSVTGCKESLQGVKKLDTLTDDRCKESLQGVSKNFTPECKVSLQGGVKKLDTIIVLDNNSNKEGENNGVNAPPVLPVETVIQKPAVIATPPKDHYFSQSEFYDKERFVQALTGTDYEVYDLSYYHETLKNWADSGTAVKFKKSNWLSTARNIMLRDAKENKAQFRTTRQPVANIPHESLLRPEFVAQQSNLTPHFQL